MVNLSNPTNGALLDRSTATGTILNDDISAPGSISIDDVSIVEGNSGAVIATFTVLRTGGQDPFSVNYATADGTATTANDDYAAAMGTLDFGSGENSRTISVTIASDTAIEMDEIFSVLLSGATANAVIADGVGIGTILDDDTPPAGLVSISDVSTLEGNSGTRTADFLVTRTRGDAAFSIDYTTSEGTATSGDGDFVPMSGTLDFLAGEMSKTISITINGDTVPETDETFSVTLSSSSPIVAIARETGVATVVNDDQFPVHVSIGDASASEGEHGTTDMTFIVSRIGGTRAFSVDYATSDGTALVVDDDYIATSGVLEFMEGETEKTILVSVNGDTDDELAETFFLTLSNPTNGVTIDRPEAAGVILPDEFVKAKPPVILSGNGQKPEIAALADGSFVVVWEDIDQKGQREIRGQIIDADGEASGSPFLVNATIGGMNIDPSVLALSGGGFVVCWSNVGGADSGIQAQFFSQDGSKTGSQFTVNEPLGTSRALVSRLPDLISPIPTELADGTVIIAWTQQIPSVENKNLARVVDPAGAAIGSEFVLKDGVSYGLIRDLKATADGSFLGAWVVPGSSSGVSEINLRRFDANGTQQGDDISIMVTASDPRADMAETMWSQILSPVVTPLEDGSIGVTWTELLTLSRTTNGFSFRRAIGHRIDVDGVVVDSGGNVSANGFEISSESIPTGRPFIGNLGELDQDASGATGGGFVAAWLEDYRPIDFTTTLSLQLFDSAGNSVSPRFAADLSADTIHLWTPSVAANDAGDLAVAWGTSVSLPTLLSVENQVAVQLFDMIGESVSVSDFSITEGDDQTRTVDIVVSRIGGNSSFSIAYSSRDGTAGADDGDYDPVSGLLYFGPDDQFMTIPVTINGDTRFENDESFSIVLSDPSIDISISNSEGIVLIGNDDQPPLGFVGFEEAAVTVQEGDTGTTELLFNVVRSGSTAPISVGYATADLRATEADNDYAGVSGTLDFADGESSKTVSLFVNGDSTAEFDENLVVMLSATSDDYVIDQPRSEGRIINDDPGRIGISSTFLGTPFADLINRLLSSLNENLSGGDGDDTLIGGSGNNLIDGGAGRDSMSGNNGDDSYIVDHLNDVVTEFTGGGTDTVFSMLPAFTLGPNMENLAGVFGPAVSGFTGIGNALNNRLAGTPGDDDLSGGDGNDTLSGGFGNDLLDGGAGIDTAHFNEGNLIGLPDLDAATNPSDPVMFGFAGLASQTMAAAATLQDATMDLPGLTRNQVSVVWDGAETVLLWGGEGYGLNTLISIERIDLIDGDYVYDIGSDNLGFGYRIYQAAFGRTPDEGGLRFWVGVLDTLDSWGYSEYAKQQYVAREFNESLEFQALYGSDPSHYDYIDAMYQNVLYRLPDQGGYDFWVGGMDQGLTEEDILIAFSESVENRENNYPNLDNGVWVV
ncbi:Calx-beta domain-containing protein [Zhengella sp.]|uniref:Calx-beta domain-containing protein n=1 Tax=Zhengella sp. TaxID=2282762 RepID=UPI003527ABFD